MLLEAKGICKRFGGLVAVNNMSLSVEKNSIVSLIGPNGAGKTTLFNLLTGFYDADEGNVVLDGQNINSVPTHNRIAKGMSRTFQNLRLFGKMTVLENVLVGYQSKISYNGINAVFNTASRKSQERLALEKSINALEKIGLLPYKDTICSSLPYGMQKRLEIARALVSEPKILLLDEPAAGLNPHETEELSNYIKTLCKEGNTIFLIEHDMKLVMSISDYVYVMDHGEMLSFGEASVVQKDPKVIEAYFGKGGSQNVAKSN